MLTAPVIKRILDRLPRLRLGVVGDLFLDRYLDLDGRLTEASVETGLDAHQVIRVRSYPGAAGTILNNLVALGVGRVAVLSIIGEDGEGYELKRALERRHVDLRYVIESPERFTPTYTKPMLQEPGKPPRELNRFDLKNRTPLPAELERQVIAKLPALFAECDALLVQDQVSEAECGVITTAARQQLAELGSAHPDKLILADSRARIGAFRNVALKPNQRECREAVGGRGRAQRCPGERRGFEDSAPATPATREECVQALAHQAGRPVFCTIGAQGMLLCNPRQPPSPCPLPRGGEGGVRGVVEVPGYPVRGAIDPVGAGDSTSAGIACAYAAGTTLAEAAAFGNLIASITIQQLGTTGTATPEQVWQRWRETGGSANRC